MNTQQKNKLIKGGLSAQDVEMISKGINADKNEFIALKQLICAFMVGICLASITSILTIIVILILK